MCDCVSECVCTRAACQCLSVCVCVGTLQCAMCYQPGRGLLVCLFCYCIPTESKGNTTDDVKGWQCQYSCNKMNKYLFKPDVDRCPLVMADACVSMVFFCVCVCVCVCVNH